MSKPPSGPRGPKGKLAQQPPDLFIALGSKGGTSRDSDPKRPLTILPKSTPLPSSKVPSIERKRETPPTVLTTVQSAKKMKMLSRSPSVGSGGACSNMNSILGHERSSGVDAWESSAIDVDATELLSAIVDALKINAMDRFTGLVLGAIRTLRSATKFAKPCKITSSTLLLICQIRPVLFTQELIFTALINSIRREMTAAVENSRAPGPLKQPTKNHHYITILFTNILWNAFSDINNWPETFFRLYCEDAVGDRIWIDNLICKPFVENIIVALNTRIPPKTLLQVEVWASGTRDTNSPLTINYNDDDEAAEQRAIMESWNVKVFPRFTHIPQIEEQIVLEVIHEQFNRRQPPETVTKNCVKFLSSACGFAEVRYLAVCRVENWIHNHKLLKVSQELLAYICYNCLAVTQRDLEVVVQLTKIRLKNKPMIVFFNNCLKEMITVYPDNLHTFLKYTIFNELSNSRNTNNYLAIGTVFQASPEASCDAFADICLEMLLSKDDFLRSLRALFKELHRVLKHDFNLLHITHALLRERKEKEKAYRESEVKDRVFVSLADLVAMSMLLCVTPQVREAATQSKRDLTVLHAFQTQVSNMHREAVTWLHDWGFKVFRPSAAECHHVLLKVLFLEQAEHYYKVDSWPPDNERILFLRLASEVPLLQATLLRILLMGITKDFPISPNDAIEISDQLIRRASNIAADLLPPLEMDKIEIIDFFFNLCSYNYPENIVLPVGYVPPKLAISSLYWKCWMILLILSAHNSSTFGSLSWSKYPTLRMFMEMCITNHFQYPPPTMIGDDGVDDFTHRELQILSLEKQSILEFETHLAAGSTKAEITEQSSLLLSQLMELNPSSDPRRPPPVIIEQLSNLNSSLRLGHLLCRSRHPDFLLDIMTRHGGTAYMPWLAELVHSSEGALAHLPVQCLCEYLLSTGPTEKLVKHTQLLTHLKKVVNGADTQIACEVLEYLLRRLTSLHTSSRAPAIRGLTLILAPGDDTEINNATINNTSWLTEYIMQFPHLSSIRPILIQFLRQAILIETNATHVGNYIKFLSIHGLDDSLPELFELVFDLSTLIIERNSITHYVLPGEGMETVKLLLLIFWVYLQKAQECSDSFYLSENQDHVLVTWATGQQCTLQVLTIHGSIILLTYGPVDDCEAFDGLIDMWFPQAGDHPKAVLIDLSEEVALIPDWLKLRMIRSKVPRLLDAAVEKLEAAQLVLFIQSFGIPVVSISKLLKVLDRVTVTNPNLVIDSVLDKNYMIQLVDVQNRRGAVGGKIFVKALEMQTAQSYEEDMQVDSIGKKELPDVAIMKQECSRIDLLSALKRVFYPQFGSDSIDQVNFICKALTSSNSDDFQTILDFIEKVRQYDLQKVLANWSVHTILRCLLVRKHANESTHRLAEQIARLLPVKHPFQITIKQFLQQFTRSTETTEQRKIIPFKSSDKLLDQSSLLAQEISQKLLDNDYEAGHKTGLLVDWLAMVELEMANVANNMVQMDLLFSKQQFSFRPLMTSMVLQRASWKTLNNVVSLLLQSENVHRLCATSVLDFLMALTQCPRLWQGRDKAVPKHYKPEDVLHLSSNKIMLIIDYILDEAKDLKDSETTMERRLNLILIPLNNATAAKLVVNKLIDLEHIPKARELLLLVYMNLPRVESFLNKRQMASFTFTKTSRSAIDVISHTILSALTANTRIKDWNQKSNDYELCARKLAATHPHLVLRQLSMLAACLRGRSCYDWNILRNRSHLLLFGQICGLMELLQPAIFQDTDTLCALLDSYMELFRYHGHNKDLYNIVSRIVTFLQHWMVHDMQNSLKYLQRYGFVLNDIEIIHPCVRPLLSSVSLPVVPEASDNEVLIGAPARPMPQPLPPNWHSLVLGLQSTDPLTSLQEIELLSLKRPQLLESIAQRLYACIGARNGQVRIVSIKLMTRYLKHNPKASQDALPAVLSCLDSKDADVVETILDKMPELIVVMQEYAMIILTRVFQLGIQSNLNAVANIGKCIDSLRLQMGC